MKRIIIRSLLHSGFFLTVLCLPKEIFSQSWSLVGNAGTDTSIHFIGTSDNMPLRFKVNSQKAGLLSSNNTLYGIGAGNGLSTGNGNTGIGNNALYSNTTGNYNIATGFMSLYSNTTGYSNTATGYGTLYYNTSGYANTANGLAALYFNTTGNSNTATGYRALYGNTTGNYNIATGYMSLYNNTIGRSNTATGYGTLYSNTEGNHNTATGYMAMHSNTTGFSNTAVGTSSLTANVSGSHNTAVGRDALRDNTAGWSNTAAGEETLANNISGHVNVAVGSQALKDNTSGSFNVAIGNNALYHNTTGDGNVASGTYTLNVATTGFYNSAIGTNALRYLTSGNYNSGFGFRTLYANTTGNNNTAVGSEADVTSGSLFNSTAIGNLARVNASNKIRFGNTLITSIEGQVAYSYPSDGRFKTNVTETVKGIDFIMKLRPVVYNFQSKKMDQFISGNEENKARFENTDYSEAENIRQSGFIAQEVEKAAKETGYDFNGVLAPKHDKDIYSMAYSQFVVPLVKGMQEQQTVIEKQNILIEEMVKRLESLEKTCGISSSFKSQVTVLSLTDEGWKVWPNPVDQNLLVSITAKVSSAVIIKAFDSKGSLVKTQQGSLLPGNNQLSMDMSRLTVGTYHLTLEWANGQERKNVTIVKR